MHPFQDTPLVGPGHELQLTLDGGAVPPPDVVAAAALEPVLTAEPVLQEREVGEGAPVFELDLARARPGALEANLFMAGERLAGRAASPATRKQYASIYRTFGAPRHGPCSGTRAGSPVMRALPRARRGPRGGGQKRRSRPRSGRP